ncbi:MAG: hypothetical protein PW788_03325 [Micavibrio sp.]|nr:hypothetical protein [Micavibrio sp.]
MKPKNYLSKIFTPVAAVTLVAAAAFGVYKVNSTEDLQVTVQGTHESLLHKGEGFGFTKTVYETDKGEFANTLSPWNGKFSRDDIENTIQVGKTYDVTVQGLSVPMLGYYPNILSAKPVTPKR